MNVLSTAVIEGQEPRVLDGGRARVPVLLVLRKPGQPECFGVADLNVWHLPLDGKRPEHLFVPAPASWLYGIDARERAYAPTFRAAIEHAGQAIERRLSPEAHPFALVWDLRPRGWGLEQPLWNLLGNSAGAAFAVAGLLALPLEHVRADLRRHVQLISGPQVGVRAALGPLTPAKPGDRAEPDALLAVGGIAHKLGILKEQEEGYAEVTKVFVGIGLADTKEAWVAQPEPCGLGQQVTGGAFTVHEVDVGDWDDDQMQRYLARRLGPEKGQRAWAKIERPAELKRFCSRPIVLSGQCDLIDAGMERPITNRARLFSALVWMRIGRHHEQQLDSGLVTAEDAGLATQISYWKQPHKMIALPQRGRSCRR